MNPPSAVMVFLPIMFLLTSNAPLISILPLKSILPLMSISPMIVVLPDISPISLLSFIAVPTLPVKSPVILPMNPPSALTVILPTTF